MRKKMFSVLNFLLQRIILHLVNRTTSTKPAQHQTKKM